MMMRVVHIAITAISALALLATIALLLIEPTWVEDPPETPHATFMHGSIGTEILPLPVMRVLPQLYPERWQPAGAGAGDWIEQFGFIRAEDTADTGLPIGFALSHHRPKSGAPSPVPFVGFSCALCHTGEVRSTLEGERHVVLGMGNHSLDLFAWVDALLGSIAEESLTLEVIDRAHETETGRRLSFAEQMTVRMWLPQAQAQVRASFAKWEEPFKGRALRDSAIMPNGPARTQAFRELVRFVLDRPGAFDHGYSKLPPVFQIGHRDWAQVDGSVRSPIARSVFAAIAAGATVENLSQPGIQANALSNVDYVSTLAGPEWAELFPEHPIDQSRAERGKQVYDRHCFSCHGGPGATPGSWIDGTQTGEVMPWQEIGTDRERVSIRHYEAMTEGLFEMLPLGSPLKPPRNQIRPGPAGTTRGYINAPLERVWLRVPYLHNGSVLTLAELINLEPRRPVFQRGRADYDVERLGLHSPQQPDQRYYYTFDTRRRGNANSGHDFPWAFKGPGWNEAELRDLLEYLKTF